MSYLNCPLCSAQVDPAECFTVGDVAVRAYECGTTNRGGDIGHPAPLCKERQTSAHLRAALKRSRRAHKATIREARKWKTYYSNWRERYRNLVAKHNNLCDQVRGIADAFPVGDAGQIDVFLALAEREMEDESKRGRIHAWLVIMFALTALGCLAVLGVGNV